MLRFLNLAITACTVVAGASGDGANEGTKAGGDYQQYLGQYAGDYQKYMQQGGGQQGGGQQGGDYQKYMSQYAGDYQTYMGGGQQGGSQQGGDYQKYMSQYAGDYQKYMGGGQQGNSQQGGDYQKYMTQYAGDYQKYMKQDAGKQAVSQQPQQLLAEVGKGDAGSGTSQRVGGQQGGDYQKYMSQYAGDYQKYMGGGQRVGGQQGGDYQKYMSQYAGDYQKYMGGGQQGGSQQGDDYKKRYVSQYAGDYRKYMQQGSGQQQALNMAAKQRDHKTSKNEDAPAKASHCHTLEALQRWRAAQRAQVDTFVPGPYRKYGKEAVEKEYAENKARIQKEMAEEASEKDANATKIEAKDDSAKDAPKADMNDQDASGASVPPVGTADIVQQPLMFFAESDMDADAASNGDEKQDKTTAEGAESDQEKKDHDDKMERNAASSDDNATVEVEPKSGPAWADQFLNKYAGNYMPEPKNSSDPKSWRDAFVKKYAGAYMHYIDAANRLHERFPDAPASAAKCHTLKQLKEWRAAAREQLESYVPKAYQVFSAGAFDQEYKDNKARIEKEIAEAKARAAAAAANESETPASDSILEADEADQALSPVLFAAMQTAGPKDNMAKYAGDYVPLPRNQSDTKAWRDALVKHFAGVYAKYVDGSNRQVAKYADAPAKASDCHTLEALQRWRAAQHAQVDTFVPCPYRTFGAGAVEQEYAENKARIEQEMAEEKVEEETEKKDDSAKDAPTSAASTPLMGASATMDRSSLPLASILAVAALATSVAFVVARPRGSRQDGLSDGLLAPEAPLAYVDVA